MAASARNGASATCLPPSSPLAGTPMQTPPPKPFRNADRLSPARHSTWPLPQFAVACPGIPASILRTDPFTMSARAAGQRPALQPGLRTARPQHKRGELWRFPDAAGLPPGWETTGPQGSPCSCTANPRPGGAHPHRHTGTRCRLAIVNCHMYGSDPIAFRRRAIPPARSHSSLCPLVASSSQ